MIIVIFGAGVQGTVYGVRLARAGHDVTLVARGTRAAQLRTRGAVVRNATSGLTDTMQLPVAETLDPKIRADLCFVFVRREQLADVLPELKAASAIDQLVIMVNHANGSEWLFAALGRERVILGFPSAAGDIQIGVVDYVEVAEQPTTIERASPNIAAIVRGAGFRVALIGDVDSWLKRHAVFVTAVGGAIYLSKGDTLLLSKDKALIRTLILAVREGWSALDRLGVAPAPLTLRAIFSWVPLPFAVSYWRRLFGSPRGDLYFARHVRRAVVEMAALKADVDPYIVGHEATHLRFLFDAIDRHWEDSVAEPDRQG